jgi:hypothetical protein
MNERKSEVKREGSELRMKNTRETEKIKGDKEIGVERKIK